MELEDVKHWWKEVTEGPLGWIIYLALGVGLAIVLNSGLSLLLSTDYPVVTVESGSMKPVLFPGDIVFVKGTTEYQVGDVIVFDGWKRTPIIHRVVAKSKRTEDGLEAQTWQDFKEITVDEMMGYHQEVDGEDVIYVTKGDNNPTCDQCQGSRELVLEDDIHGKKVLRVPYLGWVKLGGMRIVSILTS